MSEHDELLLAEPYALGALDADEGRAFEAHLKGCEECRAAVASARAAVDSLSAAVEPVALPIGAKDRVLARFRGETGGAPASPTPSPGSPNLPIILGIAFAALGFCGLLGYQWNIEKTRAEELRNEREKLEFKLKNLEREKRELEKKLKDCEKERGGLTYLKLKPNGDFKGTARAVVDGETRDVVVFGEKFEAKPGKFYKLWAFTKPDAAPSPLAAIEATGGNAVFRDKAPEGWTAFAVSEESDRNADRPSPAVVLVPG